MSLSYPLALPTATGFAEITIRARSVVGLGESPFNFAQQAQALGGERWEADVTLPAMKRAAAEDWIGWLIALNGQEGTFLMGDPVNTSPRGSWAGTPLTSGVHGARVKTLVIDGATPGATFLRGDWFGVGSGSSSHLHRLVQNSTANGLGVATLDIWPGLRESLADNTALTIASPKGLFRLNSNVREYTVGLAQFHRIRFSCIEALS